MSADLSPQNEQFILLDHIDRGTQQLRDGEGIELHGDEELRTLFERIQAEGMSRYEQSKSTRSRYTIPNY